MTEVTKQNEAQPRPHGEIKIWKSGHSFFPESLRKELGINGDKKLPYFVDARTLFITREGMTTEEILEELELLMKIIKQRTEETVGDK